jgi:hypothetical protein
MFSNFIRNYGILNVDFGAVCVNAFHKIFKEPELFSASRKPRLRQHELHVWNK